MITKKQLIEFGMRETKGDERLFHPMKKIISVSNEENQELSICVTSMRNVEELCLFLPDGSTLYLMPKTITELKIFEKCIESWEPNY
jgi:hypothetical protein